MTCTAALELESYSYRNLVAAAGGREAGARLGAAGAGEKPVKGWSAKDCHRLARGRAHLPIEAGTRRSASQDGMRVTRLMQGEAQPRCPCLTAPELCDASPRSA